MCFRLQRLTTEAGPVPPPKKKYTLRKIIWTTTALTGTFYVGSTFVAFNNQAYYDIFVDKVPLGQSMLVFAEERGWDTLTAGDVIQSSSNALMTSYRFVTDLINGTTKPEPGVVEQTTKAVQDKATEARAATFKIVKKVEPAVQEAKKEVTQTAAKAADKVETIAKEVAEKAQVEVDDLVQRAEAAIAGKPYVKDSPTPPPKIITVEVIDSSEPASPEPAKNVYDVPLPLGFEPPPGFTRPAPPKPVATEEKKPEPVPVELPLVAPAVSAASEPIITHLAGTIDNLAAFLKSDPKAAEKAGDVLETAKNDLAALVERIEVVKEQERSALESQFDEQTREYTLKLLELEMEAQDKLDSQEIGYKQLFEQERAKFIQAYREKLNRELQTQSEIINERYVNMTWLISCVLMMYVQLEGGGHRSGY